MKYMKILPVVVLIAGLAAAPVLAQGQNTENGVNENAREQIDASEGVDQAEEKRAEGKAKGDAASDQDISSKGKDVLSEEAE